MSFAMQKVTASVMATQLLSERAYGAFLRSRSETRGSRCVKRDDFAGLSLPAVGLLARLSVPLPLLVLREACSCGWLDLR